MVRLLNIFEDVRHLRGLHIIFLGLIQHPTMITSKMEALNEVINLNWAKYELVNYPLNPLRLTQISLMLTKLETLASQQCLIMDLFGTDAPIVTQIINHAFLLQL